MEVTREYLFELFRGYGRPDSQRCTRRGFEGWSTSGYTMYQYFVRHHFRDGILSFVDLDEHFVPIRLGTAQSAKTRFQFWHNLLRIIPDCDRPRIDWGKHIDWSGAISHTDTQWDASIAHLS